MEILEVSEHEHPLKLIDLQLEYPPYDEEDGDHDDRDNDDVGLITKVEFRSECSRCCEEINMYHRYYYKCMGSPSCDFSLHNFCAELPTTLEPTLHTHPLFLKPLHADGRCSICYGNYNRGGMWYICFQCYFRIGLNWAVQVGKKIIHHPCHTHPLMCAIHKPILCECSACGKEHKGIFYQCTICDGFTVHSECAFLPKTLLIQHTTNDAFYHAHPLIISYSFPIIDQRAKYYPKCRVCNDFFINTENLWIYKCDKCMYYAHVDCATSRREPFMSILSDGIGKTIKKFVDADHPHLLRLPFYDETYNVPKHLFFKESGTSDKVNLEHVSHQHPLILVDPTQCNVQTSSKINSWLLMCHNPMKKTQLLCNGCLRPIMSTMPFYMCSQRCNFSLHEWCTQLPLEIENHPGHPQHTLVFKYTNTLPFSFGVFSCAVCDLPCNGFAYCCVGCGYYVDVTCGFIPKEITHKAHPNHLLTPSQKKFGSCHMCGAFSFPKFNQETPVLYVCDICNINIHPHCALLLAETIKHKHDKHPMHLSYLPIENHKSEYFCEICEEDLNPHNSFYHCQDCVQSIHTSCASLILECEKETLGRHCKSVYYFLNIKFGGIHNVVGHPHPLSFTQGIVGDGQCSMCGLGLQYKMIFKCSECKFAIDYDCCTRLN